MTPEEVIVNCALLAIEAVIGGSALFEAVTV
jgi:hypothetical protein